jgi:hypothetical protein
MLSEANVFAWPGPDLRFVPGKGPESIAYGMLPPELMAAVKARFLERVRARRSGMVERSEWRLPLRPSPPSRSCGIAESNAL